ncbi:MAG: hypothetical protein RL497_1205 [Pseudomonadota bacterium]|jgi:Fe-S-cluster containining protein
MDQLIKKCVSAAKKKLGINPNAKMLTHSISLFQENTDLISKHRVVHNNIAFACKKGCAHCCNLRVEVLPPEVFYIANHIKTLPESHQKAHIKNLEAHSVYAQGRAFIDYNKPCPFLTEQATCGIYTVRPHKCRSNLSKSVERCIETRDPEEDSVLKTAHIKLVRETVDLYKNKKCVMHPAELGLSVLAALKDETLEIRWAKGEQVFELLPEKIML